MTSLEIVRQVIDLREQLHKLSVETGLRFSLLCSEKYREVNIMKGIEGENFYVISKYLDNPEEVKLLWHGDRETDTFKNVTQVDLDLLEVMYDDLD